VAGGVIIKSVGTSERTGNCIYFTFIENPSVF